MAKQRVYSLDELRGVMLIGIVLYHLGYDLAMFTDMSMGWFWGATVSTLRYIMAGTFMVISGVSCSLSRNNLKRGLKTLGFAMVITLVTFFALPGQVVTFGVLHYFGVMMLIFTVSRPILEKINTYFGVGFSALMFYLCYNIPEGFVSIFKLKFYLPKILYSTNLLFWAGMHNESFVSSDYYPILPWAWLFLIGAFLGLYFKKNGFPSWSMIPRCKFLYVIGQHTMEIYIVHQPILLAGLWLLGII